MALEVAKHKAHTTLGKLALLFGELDRENSPNVTLIIWFSVGFK